MYVWTFDPRLRCVSSTIPYEDELRAIFKAIDRPLCLIRSKQGMPYPESTFHDRCKSLKNLTISKLHKLSRTN